MFIHRRNKNGRKFIEEAREVVKRKPIVALKGGITQESARRAKSHMASIVGSEEIFDAVFKKAGIIRVENIGAYGRSYGTFETAFYAWRQRGHHKQCGRTSNTRCGCHG
jgi:succinyl-CoA synthetase alpha subunit